MNKLKWIGLLLVGIAFAACESADCTLQNKVVLKCAFYSDSASVKFDSAITVTALGTDSVLINRMANAHQIELPMSYSHEADTFVLHIPAPDSMVVRDTFWVKKSDYPHFESPDCPSYVFHILEDVGSTHHIIKRIQLKFPYVDFSTYEHLQIYLFTD